MLLAMGAYEGGAHALLLTWMPYGGGCLCAQVLICYLVTLTPKGTLLLPNGSSTNWHQPGVCASKQFLPHPFGVRCVGGYLY
jgi:hypothetical protein